jgi:hypothetical protein
MKALDVSDGFVIKTLEINYLDRNLSTEMLMNKTLIDTSCLDFDQTKNLKFKLNYFSPERISAIKFLAKDFLNWENRHNMNNKIFINLFFNDRICIIDKKSHSYDLVRSDLEIKFGCESKSLQDYKNEAHIEQSLRFTFKSEYFFKLKICDIFVYQFEEDCGSPDIPLHSTIEKVYETVKFYPNSGYRLIGDNTINCLFEGNWDKEPPIIEPIIQCNTSDIDLKSKIYKKIELQDFEVFNGTEVAVINSKILFQCDFGNKRSKTLVSVCDENGFWIGDDYKCK